MSFEVYRPALRTVTFVPSSSHSRTDPGARSRRERTPTGTEVRPRALSFEWENAMVSASYQGGGDRRGEMLAGASGVPGSIDRSIRKGYSSLMKIASITETKNRLSALLDKVRQGETILIMDRDRPVARLEPVGDDVRVDPKGRLAHLERTGAIRRATGKPSRLILDTRPPKVAKGASLLQALLAEREQSR